VSPPQAHGKPSSPEAAAGLEPPAFTSCVTAFDREFDFVYRALRRQGVSSADAEDLAQEVFVVMWRRWRDYQRDRPLRPWLAGIALHVAQKHARRHRRELPGGEVDPADGREHPEDHLAAAHARRVVLAALALMPERHRTPLVLHELDELSVQEIAAGLSVPLATVYTRLRRARLAFAKAVRKLEGRPSPADQATMFMALRQAPVAQPAPARRRRAIRRARAVILAPSSRLLPFAVGAAVMAVIGAVALPHLGRPPAPRVASRSAGRAAAPAATSDLLGFWKLDDGPGSSIARDDSGQGNHCRFRRFSGSTVTWLPGHSGSALAFGPHVWLQCPSFAVAGEMTVGVWIHHDAVRSYHGAIAAFRRYQGSHDGFLFAVLGEDLVLKSPAWDVSLSWPLPRPDDGWVHVAFSHGADGGTRLYVGGRRVVAAPGAPGRSLGPAPLLVGAAPAADTNHVIQHFFGAMDDLAVYRRALDDGEVAALARGQRPR
jgi:RNA polymerase sigma factor (sigma-70 family)